MEDHLPAGGAATELLNELLRHDLPTETFATDHITDVDVLNDRKGGSILFKRASSSIPLIVSFGVLHLLFEILRFVFKVVRKLRNSDRAILLKQGMNRIICISRLR